MPQKKKLKVKDENGNKSSQVDERENDASSNESEFDGEMSGEYDSNEGYSDEDDQEIDFDPNEEIMIDFEARALRESDLDSIKLMLQAKLGPFNSLNLNELGQIIVKQENLGNAIYQVVSNEDEDEEEDRANEQAQKDNKEEKEDDEFLDDTIFGILTLIDLSSEQHKSFSSKFIEFLLKQCQTNDKQNKANLKDKLNEIFQTKRVCYVINERYVNIPPAISVPMFDSLEKDLENLSPAETACNQADYWLLLSKYFIEDGKSSANGAKSSKETNTGSTLIYSNPEEEILEEFSELKFDISYCGKISKATGWSVDDPSLQPYLKAFLIPKNKINEALAKVKTEVK